MKYIVPVFLLAAFVTLHAADPMPNPLIDYPGFLANAGKVEKLRESHRLTEREFIEMAAEPGTIVLDARSANRFAQLHVKGAVSLPYTDFTAETLGEVISTKDTRILIYCNNNFLNEPVAFACKAVTVSLNLNTFNALYGYGYENVYELGPLIDVNAASLELVGSLR